LDGRSYFSLGAKKKESDNVIRYCQTPFSNFSPYSAAKYSGFKRPASETIRGISFRRNMKILLIVALLLSGSAIASAQGKMIYLHGNQKIIKLDEVRESPNYLEKYGERCGDYFMYKESPDQRFISFKMLLTGKQEVPNGEFPEHIGIELFEVLLDRTAKTPIAEYDVTRPPRLLRIRLSPKDYRAAKCLRQAARADPRWQRVS
jgi:hypothetical protein